MTVVRQYAYLSTRTDSLLPDEVTRRLRLDPDSTRERGSRRAGPPPIPRLHLWKLESGVARDRPLLDHFEALFDAIGSRESEIRELVSDDDVVGALQVVRYFEPGPESPEVLGD